MTVLQPTVGITHLYEPGRVIQLSPGLMYMSHTCQRGSGGFSDHVHAKRGRDENTSLALWCSESDMLLGPLL